MEKVKKDINKLNKKIKILKQKNKEEKIKKIKSKIKSKIKVPEYLNIAKGIKEIKEKKKLKRQTEILEYNKEKVILYKSPFYKIKKFKITGYILYELTKNSKNFSLIGINNFEDVYKTKWGKAYIKHDMLGNMNGKPLLVIKNHLPLSLKIQKVKSTKKDKDKEFYFDGYELCYDPQTFYNTFEYITFANLRIKDVQQSSFGEFLRKNWWKLALIGLVLGFVLFTEQGKQMISQLGNEMIFRHYE